MRVVFALLALTVGACSSDYSVDTRPESTPPLGTAADSALNPPPKGPQPAEASATPASGYNKGAIEWPAAFTPGAPCEATAQKAATIRTRPTVEADQFGQLAVGDKVQLLAQTADGWVGFNPGTAQAANVGIFRLRWVRASEAFGGRGNCGQLPVVAAPPAGCLLMAAQPTVVREQPAAGAGPLGTVPAGSYAVVTGSSTGPWVEVLVPGRDVHGYVASANVSFTGRCE